LIQIFLFCESSPFNLSLSFPLFSLFLQNDISVFNCQNFAKEKKKKKKKRERKRKEKQKEKKEIK